MSCCENEGKRLTLRLVGTALVDVLRNPCVIHITCLLQLRCAFLMHDPFAYKSGKQHLLLILEFIFDARLTGFGVKDFVAPPVIPRYYEF